MKESAIEGAVDELLRSAAKQLRGTQRRVFLADVCDQLCNGNPRQAEYRFGWGRETIEKGLAERAENPEALAARPASGNRGRKPWEEQNRQLAINGPKNSGVTRKFLCRMVKLADWSGMEVRLVYYPPYHSKYNPIERCWSSLQKKWSLFRRICG